MHHLHRHLWKSQSLMNPHHRRRLQKITKKKRQPWLSIVILTLKRTHRGPQGPPPQPVQGPPSQHTVPGSPIVNTGVPNTGAPVFTVQGPLQHPTVPSAGLSAAQGCAWSRHGPQETAAQWHCPL